MGLGSGLGLGLDLRAVGVFVTGRAAIRVEDGRGLEAESVTAALAALRAEPLEGQLRRAVTKRVLLPRVAATRALVHVETEGADEPVAVGLDAPGAAWVVRRGGEVVALPREVDAHHVVLAHVQPVKVRRTLLDGHLLRVQSSIEPTSTASRLGRPFQPFLVSTG